MEHFAHLAAKCRLLSFGKVLYKTKPMPFATASAPDQKNVEFHSDRLLAQVGTPSSKIIIPEDSQIVEVYRYRANGASLGSIRLVDGKVTEVNQ